MASDKIYLIATPCFPTTDSYRGCYVYDQAAAIARDGRYRPVIFKAVSPKPGKELHPYRVGEMEVHPFPYVQMPSYFLNGLTNRLNCRLFRRSLREAGIEVGDIAVCHAHTTPFGALSVTLKRDNTDIKSILQHHDLDPYMILNGRLAGWRPNVRYRARKSIRVLKSMDMHVCVSNAVRRQLTIFPRQVPEIEYIPYRKRLAHLEDIAAPHIRQPFILHNGVDLKHFRYQKLRTPHQRIRIGCVADFIPCKRQTVLIDALDILHKQGMEFEMHFVGVGPLRKECEAKVNRYSLRDRVQFTDSVERQNLPDFYGSLDLFVLPSVFEGMGCVYTEAWACGTPFIGCRGQGIEDYIADNEKDFWLATPDSASDLAVKIKYFRDHKPRQLLSDHIDIDTLIPDFINRLESMIP